MSSFASSPAASSLLFSSDDLRSSGGLVGPSSSSSSDFDLELMKIQLRASQEDLRLARAQLERLEVTRQAELTVYRNRVAELELEKSRSGGSRDKGKGRET